MSFATELRSVTTGTLRLAILGAGLLTTLPTSGWPAEEASPGKGNAAAANSSAGDESELEELVNGGWQGIPLPTVRLPKVLPADPNVAQQASNPTAPIAQVLWKSTYLPPVSGVSGPSYAQVFQGVLPLPPTRYTLPQIIKLTIPVVTTTNPTSSPGTNFGDTTVLDLFVKHMPWGALTGGAGLVIPSYAPAPVSSGRWQLGLAGGVIYSALENWQMGFIAQNFWSVGGSTNPPVNQLGVAPTFTYTNKQGWFFGLSDFSWTFDWEKGGSSIIPIGPQVGRVFRFLGQTMSLSAEVGWNVGSTGNTVPTPVYALELNFLFPER